MSEQNSKIKLAMVDDDTMVSNLLKDYFDRTDKIKTILIANSGNQFLEQLESAETLPEILVLDLRMKDGSGLEVLDQLSKMEKVIKVIVMSSHYNPSYMGQMLKLGADAFLPKEIDPEELVTIIETVYKKGHYFTEEQIVNLRSQVSPKSPKLNINSQDALSARELEVLALLCQQLTAKEIAEKLFVSPKTVEMHKSNLLLKTGVKNTAGLIIYAIQKKLINPEDIVLLD